MSGRRRFANSPFLRALNGTPPVRQERRGPPQFVPASCRARAHELVAFHIIRSPSLRRGGLEPGAGDLGQVAQDFGDVAGPATVIRARGADAVQESAGPFRERCDPIGKRRLVSGQQGFENEFV